MQRFPAISLILIAGSHASAFPTTAPSALRQFAGKTVQIFYNIDVDGDGEPNAMETQYLRDRLKEARATVIGYSVPLKLGAGDVLVLGEPIAANSPAARGYILETEWGQRQRAELNYYRENRARLSEEAKAAGVTVVEKAAATKLFGLDGDGVALRRDVFRRLAARLDTRVKDVRMEGATVDVVNDLRDTIDLNFYVDWPAMEVAGIDLHQRIKVEFKEGTARDALQLLAKQFKPIGLRPIVNADGDIHLTTKDRAANLLVREPRAWIPAEQTNEPPSELLKKAASPAKEHESLLDDPR